MSGWWSRFLYDDLGRRRWGPNGVRVVLGILLVGVLIEATYGLVANSVAPPSAPIGGWLRWLHHGLLLAAALVCASEAPRRPAGSLRWGWRCISAGLLLFALAEILWELRYPDGTAVAIPNLTDAFYLGTYPLFMAGLVLLAGYRVPPGQWHRWLDGLMIALIVATPGVVLIFLPVLERAPIDPLGKLVTISYPLGDILLLGALLGALPLISWRPDASWRWLSLGLILFTVGDSMYAVDAVPAVSHHGPYDFVWTAGALTLAVAATRRTERPSPAREITGWSAIALPVCAQLFALVIQIDAYFHEVPPEERLLTAAVLAIGIVQTVLARPRKPPAVVSGTDEGASPRAAIRGRS